MNVKKLLGQKIKKLRKNRNLTQEQLAEILEMAPRHLSRIELGENFVTADTLDKILEAFNITAEELFAYEHMKSSKDLLADIYTYLNTLKNNKNKLEKIYKLICFVKENDL